MQYSALPRISMRHTGKARYWFTDSLKTWDEWRARIHILEILGSGNALYWFSILAMRYWFSIQYGALTLAAAKAAVCCSVLQCVAVCCSVLQWFSIQYSALPLARLSKMMTFKDDFQRWWLSKTMTLRALWVVAIRFNIALWCQGWCRKRQGKNRRSSHFIPPLPFLPWKGPKNSIFRDCRTYERKSVCTILLKTTSTTMIKSKNYRYI